MKKIRIILIALVIALASCSPLTNNAQADACKSFDILCKEFFCTDAAADTLSLHIMLSEPEKYSITPGEVSLSVTSSEALKSQAAELENRLSRLQSIDREQLDTNRRLTYDICKDTYEKMLVLAGAPYLSEPLSPNSGMHLYLPLLLTEFSFEDTEDIKTYLELLKLLPDAFAGLSAFEHEKASNDTFMSDDTAKLTILQCEQFASADDNVLILSFNERVNSLDFLTKKEKKEFRKQNKELINTVVIPAYKKLADELTKLLGSGKNPNGICYFDGGRQYYENSVRLSTGSSMSVEEMKQSLNTLLGECLTKLRSAQSVRPNITNDFYDIAFPEEDPQKLYAYLSDAAKGDFPAITDITCEVLNLPESLENQAGAAMYLIPPIDDYLHNTIYINSESNPSKLMPTMAHEAYPGHLLQTVYFCNTNPNPLRHLLSVLGYDEGWATYCEVYSYTLAGFDETMTSYLQSNMLALHCLYSLADIGINYDGWSREDTQEFLCHYGLGSSTADNVRACALSDPGLYLPYSIGYIELMSLRDELEKSVGDSFTLSGFHTAFLSVGPAPFEIVSEYLYLFY